jgi:acetyl esterase
VSRARADVPAEPDPGARASAKDGGRAGGPASGSARVSQWRDTLFRRTRSFAASAFFETLAAVAKLAPVARPERHGVEVDHDVSYGPHEDWHQLDIYRPIHRPKPWPVVFYVHGGAFHLLSKDTHWIMGLVFARVGYLVGNISYRLAPAHPYPAAIEDVCRAYRWLGDHIDELGGDRDRVVVAGESAGGNLIAALALAMSQRRAEPWARDTFDCGLVPRAAMPFCAMLQVTDADRFARRRKMPRWATGMIHDAGASYLHGHSRMPAPTTELADPLLVFEAAARDPASVQFDRPLPAFFAPVGTRDPLLDDTRRLDKALTTLGVPCETRYYPGGIHAFHAMVWNPAARRCWRDALAFLDRYDRAR